MRKLANSLLFEVHDSIKDLPGATPARKLLVTRALEYLDSLSRESGSDPSLRQELASAYERVGDVQGNIDGANLGDTSGAMDSYRKALAIRESLAANRGGNPEQSQRELANDYERLGISLQGAGNYPSALEEFRKAMPIRQRVAAEEPNPVSQEYLAGDYFQIAYCQGSMGDHKSALENYQRSAAIRESIAGDSPAHYARVQMRLAGTYGYISGIRSIEGDYDQAIAMERKAEEMLQKLSDADPSNAMYRHYLYQAHYWFGFYLEKSGDVEQALQSYRRALQGLEVLTSADPKEVSTKEDVALCERSIGGVLIARGETTDGSEHIRKALAVFEDLSRADPTHNFDKLSEIANTYSATGQAYSRAALRPNTTDRIRMERWQEARSAFQKSLDAWSKIELDAPSGSARKGPETVSREISKCDAAIAKLNNSHQVR